MRSSLHALNFQPGSQLVNQVNGQVVKVNVTITAHNVLMCSRRHTAHSAADVYTQHYSYTTPTLQVVQYQTLQCQCGCWIL
jgi:hypothetical protein